MFKKKENTYENIESLISAGVEIKGNINSAGTIRVDGTIEGGLHVKNDVILGKNGKVKGEVTAKNIILAGRVEGNVVVQERFEIASTGNMIGDVTCSIITIEEGGVLEGNTKMAAVKEKAANKKEAKAT